MLALIHYGIRQRPASTAQLQDRNILLGASDPDQPTGQFSYDIFL